MELSELTKTFFLSRAALSLCGGFLLFALVWWLGKDRRALLSLAALGAGWLGCHLALSILSGIFPPREPMDWLVFGSGTLVLLAAGSSFHKSNPRIVAAAAAVLLAVTFWKLLDRFPYLLSPQESPGERRQWILYGLGALLVVFASAECLVRGIPPAATAAVAGIFAAAAALALWKLGTQDKMVKLPLVLALMAGGAALAALFFRQKAILPPGWAGWFAGGVFIIFVRSVLSRADSVPLPPIGAAAAAIPAAALFVILWRRFFRDSRGLAAAAAVLMAGSGVFYVSAIEQSRRAMAEPPAGPTGADDTGAYDGL